MNTFNINGKEYKARPFGFNEVCELDEEYGIRIDQMQSKPMSLARAYFAMSSGLPKDVAGKEIENHVINGGKLDEIFSIMMKEFEESGFFRALSQTAKAEATEEKAEEVSTTTKTTTKKKTLSR